MELYKTSLMRVYGTLQNQLNGSLWNSAMSKKHSIVLFLMCKTIKNFSIKSYYLLLNIIHLMPSEKRYPYRE